MPGAAPRFHSGPRRRPSRAARRARVAPRDSGLRQGRADPRRTLASGKEAQAARKHKAAIIQFNNVIQKQPTHAEANYLIGLEYLRIGDFQWAETHLRQAEAGGYDKAKVVAPLVKTLLSMRQFQPALDLTDINPPSDARVHGEVLAMRGLALITLGRRDEAAKVFTQALALAPELPEALTGQAQLALD